jgi:hypothetical protein
MLEKLGGILVRDGGPTDYFGRLSETNPIIIVSKRKRGVNLLFRDHVRCMKKSFLRARILNAMVKGERS